MRFGAAWYLRALARGRGVDEEGEHERDKVWRYLTVSSSFIGEINAIGCRAPAIRNGIACHKRYNYHS